VPASGALPKWRLSGHLRRQLRQDEKPRADPARAKDALKRNGKFVSKAGIVRTRLGCPGISTELERKVRAELAKGTGIVKTAKLVGVGNGTVHRIRREMGA